MKKLFITLALAAAASLQAQLLSDFSDFAGQNYGPNGFSWDTAVVQNAGFITVGAPAVGSGSIDMAIGTALNNTTIGLTAGSTQASLTARVDAGNAATRISVSLFDTGGVPVATASFFTSALTSSFTSVTAPLVLTGVGNPGAVLYFSVSGDGDNLSNFRASLDSLSVVPEPSSVALGLGAVALVGAVWFRRRKA